MASPIVTCATTHTARPESDQPETHSQTAGPEPPRIRLGKQIRALVQSLQHIISHHFSPQNPPVSASPRTFDESDVPEQLLEKVLSLDQLLRDSDLIHIAEVDPRLRGDLLDLILRTLMLQPVQATLYHSTVASVLVRLLHADPSYLQLAGTSLLRELSLVAAAISGKPVDLSSPWTKPGAPIIPLGIIYDEKPRSFAALAPRSLGALLGTLRVLAGMLDRFGRTLFAAVAPTHTRAELEQVGGASTRGFLSSLKLGRSHPSVVSPETLAIPVVVQLQTITEAALDAAMVPFAPVRQVTRSGSPDTGDGSSAFDVSELASHDLPSPAFVAPVASLIAIAALECFTALFAGMGRSGSTALLANESQADAIKAGASLRSSASQSLVAIGLKLPSLPALLAEPTTCDVPSLHTRPLYSSAHVTSRSDMNSVMVPVFSSLDIVQQKQDKSDILGGIAAAAARYTTSAKVGEPFSLTQTNVESFPSRIIKLAWLAAVETYVVSPSLGSDPEDAAPILALLGTGVDVAVSLIPRKAPHEASPENTKNWPGADSTAGKGGHPKPWSPLIIDADVVVRQLTAKLLGSILANVLERRFAQAAALHPLLSVPCSTESLKTPDEEAGSAISVASFSVTLQERMKRFVQRVQLAKLPGALAPVPGVPGSSFGNPVSALAAAFGFASTAQMRSSTQPYSVSEACLQNAQARAHMPGAPLYLGTGVRSVFDALVLGLERPLLTARGLTFGEGWLGGVARVFVAQAAIRLLRGIRNFHVLSQEETVGIIVILLSWIGRASLAHLETQTANGTYVGPAAAATSTSAPPHSTPSLNSRTAGLALQPASSSANSVLTTHSVTDREALHMANCVAWIIKEGLCAAATVTQQRFILQVCVTLMRALLYPMQPLSLAPLALEDYRDLDKRILAVASEPHAPDRHNVASSSSGRSSSGLGHESFTIHPSTAAHYDETVAVMHSAAAVSHHVRAALHCFPFFSRDRLSSTIQSHVASDRSASNSAAVNQPNKPNIPDPQSAGSIELSSLSPAAAQAASAAASVASVLRHVAKGVSSQYDSIDDSAAAALAAATYGTADAATEYAAVAIAMATPVQSCEIASQSLANTLNTTTAAGPSTPPPSPSGDGQKSLTGLAQFLIGDLSTPTPPGPQLTRDQMTACFRGVPLRQLLASGLPLYAPLASMTLSQPALVSLVLMDVVTGLLNALPSSELMRPPSSLTVAPTPEVAPCGGLVEGLTQTLTEFALSGIGLIRERSANVLREVCIKFRSDPGLIAWPLIQQRERLVMGALARLAATNTPEDDSRTASDGKSRPMKRIRPFRADELVPSEDVSATLTEWEALSELLGHATALVAVISAGYPEVSETREASALSQNRSQTSFSSDTPAEIGSSWQSENYLDKDLSSSTPSKSSKCDPPYVSTSQLETLFDIARWLICFPFTRPAWSAAGPNTQPLIRTVKHETDEFLDEQRKQLAELINPSTAVYFHIPSLGEDVLHRDSSSKENETDPYAYVKTPPVLSKLMLQTIIREQGWLLLAALFNYLCHSNSNVPRIVGVASALPDRCVNDLAGLFTSVLCRKLEIMYKPKRWTNLLADIATWNASLSRDIAGLMLAPLTLDLSLRRAALLAMRSVIPLVAVPSMKPFDPQSESSTSLVPGLLSTLDSSLRNICALLRVLQTDERAYRRIAESRPPPLVNGLVPHHLSAHSTQAFVELSSQATDTHLSSNLAHPLLISPIAPTCPGSGSWLSTSTVCASPALDPIMCEVKSLLYDIAVALPPTMLTKCGTTVLQLAVGDVTARHAALADLKCIAQTISESHLNASTHHCVTDELSAPNPSSLQDFVALVDESESHIYEVGSPLPTGYIPAPSTCNSNQSAVTLQSLGSLRLATRPSEVTNYSAAAYVIGTNRATTIVGPAFTELNQRTIQSTSVFGVAGTSALLVPGVTHSAALNSKRRLTRRLAPDCVRRWFSGKPRAAYSVILDTALERLPRWDVKWVRANEARRCILRIEQSLRSSAAESERAPHSQLVTSAVRCVSALLAFSSSPDEHAAQVITHFGVFFSKPIAHSPANIALQWNVSATLTLLARLAELATLCGLQQTLSFTPFAQVIEPGFKAPQNPRRESVSTLSESDSDLGFSQPSEFKTTNVNLPHGEPNLDSSAEVKSHYIMRKTSIRTGVALLLEYMYASPLMELRQAVSQALASFSVADIALHSNEERNTLEADSSLAKILNVLLSNNYMMECFHVPAASAAEGLLDRSSKDTLVAPPQASAKRFTILTLMMTLARRKLSAGTPEQNPLLNSLAGMLAYHASWNLRYDEWSVTNPAYGLYDQFCRIMDQLQNRAAECTLFRKYLISTPQFGKCVEITQGALINADPGRCFINSSKRVQRIPCYDPHLRGRFAQLYQALILADLLPRSHSYSASVSEAYRIATDLALHPAYTYSPTLIQSSIGIASAVASRWSTHEEALEVIQNASLVVGRGLVEHTYLSLVTMDHGAVRASALAHLYVLARLYCRVVYDAAEPRVSVALGSQYVPRWLNWSLPILESAMVALAVEAVPSGECVQGSRISGYLAAASIPPSACEATGLLPSREAVGISSRYTPSVLSPSRASPFSTASSQATVLWSPTCTTGTLVSRGLIPALPLTSLLDPCSELSDTDCVHRILLLLATIRLYARLWPGEALSRKWALALPSIQDSFELKSLFHATRCHKFVLQEADTTTKLLNQLTILSHVASLQDRDDLQDQITRLQKHTGRSSFAFNTSEEEYWASVYKEEEPTLSTALVLRARLAPWGLVHAHKSTLLATCIVETAFKLAHQSKRVRRLVRVSHSLAAARERARVRGVGASNRNQSSTSEADSNEDQTGKNSAEWLLSFLRQLLAYSKQSSESARSHLERVHSVFTYLTSAASATTLSEVLGIGKQPSSKPNSALSKSRTARSRQKPGVDDEDFDDNDDDDDENGEDDDAAAAGGLRQGTTTGSKTDASTLQGFDLTAFTSARRRRRPPVQPLISAKLLGGVGALQGFAMSSFLGDVSIFTQATSDDLLSAFQELFTSVEPGCLPIDSIKPPSSNLEAYLSSYASGLGTNSLQDRSLSTVSLSRTKPITAQLAATQRAHALLQAPTPVLAAIAQGGLDRPPNVLTPSGYLVLPSAYSPLLHLAPTLVVGASASQLPTDVTDVSTASQPSSLEVALSYYMPELGVFALAPQAAKRTTSYLIDILQSFRTGTVTICGEVLECPEIQLERVALSPWSLDFAKMTVTLLQSVGGQHRQNRAASANPPEELIRTLMYSPAALKTSFFAQDLFETLPYAKEASPALIALALESRKLANLPEAYHYAKAYPECLSVHPRLAEQASELLILSCLMQHATSNPLASQLQVEVVRTFGFAAECTTTLMVSPTDLTKLYPYGPFVQEYYLAPSHTPQAERASDIWTLPQDVSSVPALAARLSEVLQDPQLIRELGLRRRRILKIVAYKLFPRVDTSVTALCVMPPPPAGSRPALAQLAPFVLRVYSDCARHVVTPHHENDLVGIAQALLAGTVFVDSDQTSEALSMLGLCLNDKMEKQFACAGEAKWPLKPLQYYRTKLGAKDNLGKDLSLVLTGAAARLSALELVISPLTQLFWGGQLQDSRLPDHQSSIDLMRTIARSPRSFWSYMQTAATSTQCAGADEPGSLLEVLNGSCHVGGVTALEDVGDTLVCAPGQILSDSDQARSHQMARSIRSELLLSVRKIRQGAAFSISQGVRSLVNLSEQVFGKDLVDIMLQASAPSPARDLGFVPGLVAPLTAILEVICQLCNGEFVQRHVHDASDEVDLDELTLAASKSLADDTRWWAMVAKFFGELHDSFTRAELLSLLLRSCPSLLRLSMDIIEVLACVSVVAEIDGDVHKGLNESLQDLTRCLFAACCSICWYELITCQEASGALEAAMLGIQFILTPLWQSQPASSSPNQSRMNHVRLVSSLFSTANHAAIFLSRLSVLSNRLFTSLLHHRPKGRPTRSLAASVMLSAAFVHQSIANRLASESSPVFKFGSASDTTIQGPPALQQFIQRAALCYGCLSPRVASDEAGIIAALLSLLDLTDSGRPTDLDQSRNGWLDLLRLKLDIFEVIFTRVNSTLSASEISQLDQICCDVLLPSLEKTMILITEALFESPEYQQLVSDCRIDAKRICSARDRARASRQSTSEHAASHQGDHCKVKFRLDWLPEEQDDEERRIKNEAEQTDREPEERVGYLNFNLNDLSSAPNFDAEDEVGIKLEWQFVYSPSDHVTMESKLFKLSLELTPNDECDVSQADQDLDAPVEIHEANEVRRQPHEYESELTVLAAPLFDVQAKVEGMRALCSGRYEDAALARFVEYVLLRLELDTACVLDRLVRPFSLFCDPKGDGFVKKWDDVLDESLLQKGSSRGPYMPQAMTRIVSLIDQLNDLVTSRQGSPICPAQLGRCEAAILIAQQLVAYVPSRDEHIRTLGPSNVDLVHANSKLLTPVSRILLAAPNAIALLACTVSAELREGRMGCSRVPMSKLTLEVFARMVRICIRILIDFVLVDIPLSTLNQCESMPMEEQANILRTVSARVSALLSTIVLPLLISQVSVSPPDPTTPVPQSFAESASILLRGEVLRQFSTLATRSQSLLTPAGQTLAALFMPAQKTVMEQAMRAHQQALSKHSQRVEALKRSLMWGD